jgi:hypothetical protein
LAGLPKAGRAIVDQMRALDELISRYELDNSRPRQSAPTRRSVTRRRRSGTKGRAPISRDVESKSRRLTQIGAGAAKSPRPRRFGSRLGRDPYAAATTRSEGRVLGQPRLGDNLPQPPCAARRAAPHSPPGGKLTAYTE